jgi:hypothetical protein
MPDYLQNLYGALRAVIQATWPDLHTDGIWDTEYIETFPWIDLYEKKKIPYAVINIPKMGEGEWGVDNVAYDQMIYVYKVTLTNRGDSAPLRADIENLRDALLQWNPPSLMYNGYPAGQVLDVPELNWAENMSPNDIFMENDLVLRAARVGARVVIGQTFVNT